LLQQPTLIGSEGVLSFGIAFGCAILREQIQSPWHLALDAKGERTAASAQLIDIVARQEFAKEGAASRLV
jgi:hypothetical protein